MVTHLCVPLSPPSFTLVVSVVLTYAPPPITFLYPLFISEPLPFAPPPSETFLWVSPSFISLGHQVFFLLQPCCELIMNILTGLRDSSCSLFKMIFLPFELLFCFVLLRRNKFIHVNEKNSLKAARPGKQLPQPDCCCDEKGGRDEGLSLGKAERAPGWILIIFSGVSPVLWKGIKCSC